MEEALGEKHMGRPKLLFLKLNTMKSKAQLVLCARVVVGGNWEWDIIADWGGDS